LHTRQTTWSVFLDGSVATVRISRDPARRKVTGDAEALPATFFAAQKRGWPTPPKCTART